jgi:hypothetical protein
MTIDLILCARSGLAEEVTLHEIGGLLFEHAVRREVAVDDLGHRRNVRHAESVKAQLEQRSHVFFRQVVEAARLLDNDAPKELTVNHRYPTVVRGDREPPPMRASHRLPAAESNRRTKLGELG